MPNLHIVADPPMTQKLVQAGAFVEDPLVVVDVGARGGVEWFWQVFGEGVRIVAFEPDPVECARLQATAKKNVTYLPLALAAERGTRTFHVTQSGATGSFYPSDPAWCGRFDVGDSLRVQSEIELATTGLDDALAGKRADFLKLDVEGAELEVLRGADLRPVLGLVTEVRFTPKMSRSPAFADLDIFCRAAGFDLYDLDLYRYSRRPLPYPYLYDYHDGAGHPSAGPTVQGQPLIGDALYLRDGLTTGQPVKLACLFELFGLSDCAAETLIGHRADFAHWADPDLLLDMLVPQVKNERLSYADYTARHAAGERLFRPTSGRRTPDPIVSHYDGVFTPSWSPPPPPPPPGLCERLRRWLIGKTE